MKKDKKELRIHDVAERINKSTSIIHTMLGCGMPDELKPKKTEYMASNNLAYSFTEENIEDLETAFKWKESMTYREVKDLLKQRITLNNLDNTTKTTDKQREAKLCRDTKDKPIGKISRNFLEPDWKRQSRMFKDSDRAVKVDNLNERNIKPFNKIENIIESEGHNEQTIIIDDRNGQLLVSSREIAKNFNKKHYHVVEAIEDKVENLTHENSGVKITDLFLKDTFKHKGNHYKKYLLTRDGFSFIVMGFTGAKADQWKLKYIEAFNKMEKALMEDRASYMIEDPVERAKAWIKEQEEKEELELKTKQQQQIIGELKPKSDYTDRILKSSDLVTITQISKDYGMSGQAMNTLLHDLEVQYKASGQWLLYKDYQDKGYTHSQTIEYVKANGSIGTNMHTKWTQKGRLFLYDLLKEKEVLPLIER